MDTNAQRQARWRQRQKARIAELEKKAPASDEALRNAELQIEIISLRRALAKAEGDLKRARAAVSKPPRKPPDPDSVEARLKTANRNLRSELAYMKRWYETEMLRNGKMPLATHRAIIKCLHNDSRDLATEKDKDTACRLFNDFWRTSKH